MKKLPRPGTIARDVLDYLKDFSQPMPDGTSPCGATFSELLDTYVYSAKSRGSGGRRQYASMNLIRILKAHAHKTGPEGSHAVWLIGPRPPKPSEPPFGMSDGEAREATRVRAESQLIGPNHVLLTYPPMPKVEPPFESERTKELRRAAENWQKFLEESIENDVLLCEMQKEVAKFHDSKTLLILREAVDERLRQISAEVIK